LHSREDVDFPFLGEENMLLPPVIFFLQEEKKKGKIKISLTSAWPKKEGVFSGISSFFLLPFREGCTSIHRK